MRSAYTLFINIFLILTIGKIQASCPFHKEVDMLHDERFPSFQRQNTATRHFYDENRLDKLDNVQNTYNYSSFILNNPLRLIKDNVTYSASRRETDLFTQTKYVSHLQLGVWSILYTEIAGLDGRSQAIGNIPLSNRTIEQGTIFLQNFTLFGTEIALMDLNNEQKEIQNKIVNDCSSFLTKIIEDRVVNVDEAYAWARTQENSIQTNIDISVRNYLTWLDEEVMGWKTDLFNETEWGRLVVILQGLHMPRKGEVTYQYFSRILQEPMETGHRIIFAENMVTDAEAMSLFATHNIDGTLAKGFFDDPNRMHRDILADQGTVVLDEMFPNLPNPNLQVNDLVCLTDGVLIASIISLLLGIAVGSAGVLCLVGRKVTNTHSYTESILSSAIQ